MHHLKLITFLGLITALLVAIYNLQYGCYGCGGMAQLMSGFTLFFLIVVLGVLILRIIIRAKKRRYLISFLIVLGSYIAFEIISETLKNKRAQKQGVETNHFKSLIDKAWSTGNDLESSMAVVTEAKEFSKNSSASYILEEKIQTENDQKICLKIAFSRYSYSFRTSS